MSPSTSHPRLQEWVDEWTAVLESRDGEGGPAPRDHPSGSISSSLFPKGSET